MEEISKVVIPAAGLGTRLLPTTKEQPKEMLPIFAFDNSKYFTIKPIVQVIYEQLYEFGLREYYFIVGRTKRAIEDHFTPDYEYVDRLNSEGKNNHSKGLKEFYLKLEKSNLVWINQPKPLGFGHSVLLTKNLIGNNPFLVHAGDTVIISNRNRHLHNLLRKSSSTEDCRMLVNKVDDPRQFGVVEGEKNKNNEIQVKRLEEKPSNPRTNLAIMPLYRFEPSIFLALEKTMPDKRNEIQLTDAIKRIVKQNGIVKACELSKRDIWIDVGSPETYWRALRHTHDYYKKN